MFRVGTAVKAEYSGDAEMYPARIEKVLPNGKFEVLFVDYGNTVSFLGRLWFCARVFCHCFA